MNTPSYSPSEKDIAERICRSADIGLAPAAKQRIRQRLLSECHQQKYRHRPDPVPTGRRLAAAPAVAVVAAVVIIGAGIGTVSAANNARPGDRLFPIDQAVERVRLAVTANQSQRAKMLADIAKERTQEHAELAAERNTNAAAAEQLASEAVSRAYASNDAARAELIERGDALAVADLNQARDEMAAIIEDAPASRDTMGLTAAAVTLAADTATVTLKLNAAVATFQLPTRDVDAIETAIAERTGIDRQKIKSMLAIESDDDLADPVSDNPPAAPDGTDLNDATAAATPDDNQTISNSAAPDDQSNTNETSPQDANDDGSQTAGWSINVAVSDGMANIGISRNGLAVFAWAMPASDVDQIVANISQKTGLTAEQIRARWHWEAD